MSETPTDVACYADGIVLGLCLLLAGVAELKDIEACASCPLNAAIAIGIGGCLSSDLDQFCTSVQSCGVNECHTTCLDELQALTGCMLMGGGCSGNHCDEQTTVSPATEVTATVTPTSSPLVTEVTATVTPTSPPLATDTPTDVACYDEGMALGLCLVSAGVTDDAVEACASCPLNAAIASGINGCSSSDLDSFCSSVQSCGVNECHTTCLDDAQAVADCMLRSIQCLDTCSWHLETTVSPASSPPVVETPTDVTASTAPTPSPIDTTTEDGSAYESSPTVTEILTDVAPTTVPIFPPINAATVYGSAHGGGIFAVISLASFIYCVGIM